jgi:hypothetical protein
MHPRRIVLYGQLIDRRQHQAAGESDGTQRLGDICTPKQGWDSGHVKLLGTTPHLRKLGDKLEERAGSAALRLCGKHLGCRCAAPPIESRPPSERKQSEDAVSSATTCSAP